MMKKMLLITLFVLFQSNSAFSKWNPGDSLVDGRDGQVYRTVVIGNQVWMADNLNIGTMIESTKPGYQMSDNNSIEKYCWDNDEDYCEGINGAMKKGGFYEWKEAMQYWNGQPQLPVQGICPKNWHIPSNVEWNELLNNLGGNTAYSKMLVGGGSGFDALLTGYRCTMSGSFRPSAMSEDTRTYYWTSEQTDLENAPMIEIGQNSITSFAFSKSLGLCIRCIWNGETSDVDNSTNLNGQIEIKISPNPATESTLINLSLDNNSKTQIEIVDLSGRTIKTILDKYIKKGNYSYNINTADFESGYYFLKLQSARNIKVIPLIVIH